MTTLTRLRRFLALPFDLVGWEADCIAREDARMAAVLGFDRRGGRDRREYEALVWAHAERRVAQRRSS